MTVETTTAHYYEHYPHWMGTINRTFKFNIEKMDELYEKFKADDDDWYDELEDLGDAYALGDIVRSWPKIRRALERKGEWGDEWEEGSHAISMNNLKEARATIGRIELDVADRCGEW